MVFRRLLVIALLALVSVAGVMATTTVANTDTRSTPVGQLTAAPSPPADNATLLPPALATDPATTPATSATPTTAGSTPALPTPTTSGAGTHPTPATAAHASVLYTGAAQGGAAQVGGADGGVRLPFGVTGGSRGGGSATGTSSSVPCVQQASCAGGAMLAGAAMLLFLPASRLALPGLVPVTPVAPAPAPLRSALLTSRLYRPPKGS